MQLASLAPTVLNQTHGHRLAIGDLCVEGVLLLGYRGAVPFLFELWQVEVVLSLGVTIATSNEQQKNKKTLKREKVYAVNKQRCRLGC